MHGIRREVDVRRPARRLHRVHLRRLLRNPEPVRHRRGVPGKVRRRDGEDTQDGRRLRIGENQI